MQNFSHFPNIGNKELLKEHKTAFLCSRKCPASIVLKSYDWAIAQREAGKCVISGFHSKIEKDVLHYLLKGRQPVILALARGLKSKIEPEIQQAIEEYRLLVVTPFDKSIKRITSATATKRNEFMAELADELFVAYASPNGKLQTLISQNLAKGKKIVTFDVEENLELIRTGVLPRQEMTVNESATQL